MSHYYSGRIIALGEGRSWARWVTGSCSFNVNKSQLFLILCIIKSLLLLLCCIPNYDSSIFWACKVRRTCVWGKNSGNLPVSQYVYSHNPGLSVIDIVINYLTVWFDCLWFSFVHPPFYPTIDPPIDGLLSFSHDLLTIAIHLFTYQAFLLSYSSINLFFKWSCSQMEKVSRDG